MQVRLLGTGSADGWPNAFCECASCLRAAADGELRAPTSALVDDRLLLDCGPETPRAALRHASGLTRVTHLLITHDHPDHSAPMALLSRSWAARTTPLTVVAPEAVVTSWARWTGPDDDVRWRIAVPGDVVEADGYRVRVLEAAHSTAPSGPGGGAVAVLYDVTGPDGDRLLYATDTGRLPVATLRAATRARYDLVLLEATFGDRSGPGAPSSGEHLDLLGFADQVARLRAVGAVTERTQVAAVHLSHHSPADLHDRLAGYGARAVPDGHLFDLPATGPAAPQPVQRPRRTLVTGGARSGKSVTAERLVADLGPVTYVATGGPAGQDVEWAQRVQLHRDRRPAHWTTLETTDLAGALRESHQPLLVDCLGTWLTAVLTACGAWTDEDGWRDRLDARVDDLLAAWHGVRVPVVAVTNEVGSGVVPATASGRVFRDELGRLNARVSAASERVLLVVSGRLLDLSIAQPTTMVQKPQTVAAQQHHSPEVLDLTDPSRRSPG
jgi:adenosylcobinamide kinase/adenosylcobinamide-phosphate guanylyltransferase